MVEQGTNNESVTEVDMAEGEAKLETADETESDIIDRAAVALSNFEGLVDDDMTDIDDNGEDEIDDNKRDKKMEEKREEKEDEPEDNDDNTDEEYIPTAEKKRKLAEPTPRRGRSAPVPKRQVVESKQKATATKSENAKVRKSVSSRARQLSDEGLFQVSCLPLIYFFYGQFIKHFVNL